MVCFLCSWFLSFICYVLVGYILLVLSIPCPCPPRLARGVAAFLKGHVRVSFYPPWCVIELYFCYAGFYLYRCRWSCLFVTLGSTYVRFLSLWWCTFGLVAFYIPRCFGAFRACPPLLRCLRATAFLKGPGHIYGWCFLILAYYQFLVYLSVYCLVLFLVSV